MYPQLQTVGVVVKSMPKALAFYRILGLQIPANQDDDPHGEYAPGTGCSIGFVTEALVSQTDPQWKDGLGHRINLQFAFDTPAEVDAAHAKLTAAGHANYTAPWDAFWGQRFARVVDPDGNCVNLYAQLPEQA